MSDADPAQPKRPLAAIEQDLSCLHCGYNLRGLSGDPVRCPECGFQNPLGDAEIPAPIIKRQLEKMESTPALALAAVLSILLVAPLTWEPFSEFVVFAIVWCVAALITWVFAAQSFRNSCLGKPGWFAALMRYHLWGLILIVSTIGAVAVVISAACWAAYRLGIPQDFAPVAFAVVALAALAVVVPFWVRWVYRRAKEPMEALQREVAVTLARRELRRRMARYRELHG